MKNRHSKLIVTPSDFMTGGADLMQKPWIISYYFFNDDYPKGKQIRIKGMNFCDTLLERRHVTRELIENEITLLSNGYNPITKEQIIHQFADITDRTYFIQALKQANELLTAEHHTKQDISSVVRRIERHAAALNLTLTPISEIRRRDVVKLLDMCMQVDKISANRYNKSKGYLSILFRFLAQREIIEFNFITSIDSKRETRYLRNVITSTERERLYVLEDINYPFFRFLMVFFHSGARLTELLNLKVKDVNLDKQEYKVLIKKGSYSKEHMKPIANDAMKYWREVIHSAQEEQYVFSIGLIPGETNIRRDQITRRFRMWCKEGLGIKADMYTLKHAHLDDIAKLIGISTARDLAGHTSLDTTKIYTQQEKQRRLNELKGLDLKL